MKSEELIQKHKRTSRSTRHGEVMFPIMDKELYKRFIDTRKEGKWIKSRWFNTQAKRIMNEHVENVENSEDVENFKMSATWFVGFF